MSHAAHARPAARSRTGHASAAAVAVLVAAVAVAAPRFGERGWLAGVGLLQLALTWAYVYGTAFPGRIGGVLLGVGAGAGADALLRADHRDGLAPLLTVYGLLLPAMLLHQLSRGVVRRNVTESLAGVAGCAIAVAALAALVQLREVSPPVAGAALLAGAAGVLAGRILDSVHPGETFGAEVFHGLVGVVGSTVAGAAAAVARLHATATHGDPAVSTMGAALLGGGIGVTVGFVAVGAAYVSVTARPRRTPFAPLTLPMLKVLLPLAATAPVAYLLGLVVTG